MPNWVRHHLTITGPEWERKRFMDECFTQRLGPYGSEADFDFDRLIPEPNWKETASIHCKEPGGGDLNLGATAGEGHSFPDWYEWRCKYWGTKWNACSTEVYVFDSIRLSFETAWAPPGPIFELLAERFPGLKIEGTILEEGYGFGGDITIHAGNIDYIDRSKEIEAEYLAACADLDRRRAEQPEAKKELARSIQAEANDEIPF